MNISLNYLLLCLLWLCSNLALASISQCTRDQFEKLQAFILMNRVELCYVYNVDAEIFNIYMIKGGHMKNCYKIYHEGRFDEDVRARKLTALKHDILYGEWERELKASDAEVALQAASFMQLPPSLQNQIVLADVTRSALFSTAMYFRNCPQCLTMFQQQLTKVGGKLALIAHKYFSEHYITEIFVTLLKNPKIVSESTALIVSDTKVQDLVVRTVNMINPHSLETAGVWTVPAVAGLTAFGYEVWQWYYNGQSGSRTVSNIIASGSGLVGSQFGCMIGSAWGPAGCILGSLIGGYLSTSAAKAFFDRLFSLPADEAVEKAYNFLGVSPTASNDQVKAAYHRLSKKYHPDKGGKAEDFVNLGIYYEIIQAERAKIPTLSDTRYSDIDPCYYKDPKSRQDAGYIGIKKNYCLQQRKYTCWDESNPNVPNCYYSKQKFIDRLTKLISILKTIISMENDCLFYSIQHPICMKKIPYLKTLIELEISHIEDHLQKGMSIQLEPLDNFESKKNVLKNSLMTLITEVGNHNEF